MSKVFPTQKPHSLIIRRSLGRKIYQQEGGIYSEACYGWGEYGGDENLPEKDFHGVYQMRYCKEGYIPVKMKFYKSGNPKSDRQVEVRNNLASAVSSWQSLTPSQKNVYNKKAERFNMSGYNLYIKNYLLSF